MNSRTRVRLRAALILTALAVVLAGVSIALAYPRLVDLWLSGDDRRLRAPSPRAAAPEAPDVLVLALDGTRRDVLYAMLEAGELPGFAALFGDDAYLEPHLAAVLPADTAPGWSTLFTGVDPARHGVVGNEFFVRSTAEFHAPIPVSLDDPSPILAIYTEGYLDSLIAAPTVYEQMRQREPGIRIWVAMSQVFRGADRLLLADRSVAARALAVRLGTTLGVAETRALFGELDDEITENVIEALAADSPPDVLSIWVPGVDQYAHAAPGAVEDAQREYLREVVDPNMARLAEALDQRGALDDRYVVAVADHGHTDVIADEVHSLIAQREESPIVRVVSELGYRVRPLARQTDLDFQAVFAFQDGLAYLYLADRSGCREPGERCDWTQHAPRADVLAAADAIARAAADGPLAGAIERILVRDESGRFDVYEDGSLRALRGSDVAAHFRFMPRWRALTRGPHADRLGDLVLIAAVSERPIDSRYYFAPAHESGHGSPAASDGEIPLILGHRERTRAELERVARRVLGREPSLDAVGRLLVELRSGQR